MREKNYKTDCTVRRVLYKSIRNQIQASYYCLLFNDIIKFDCLKLKRLSVAGAAAAHTMNMKKRYLFWIEWSYLKRTEEKQMYSKHFSFQKKCQWHQNMHTHTHTHTYIWIHSGQRSYMPQKIDRTGLIELMHRYTLIFG